MTDFSERRSATRVSIPGRPGARTQDIPETRLVDLSVTGARIGHLVLLRPGASVSLELPTAMRPQILAAGVVWSKVTGGEQTLDGGGISSIRAAWPSPASRRMRCPSWRAVWNN